MFDQLRALAPQRQLLLIVAVAVTLAVLIAVAWAIFFRISYQPLFTDLRPADAATIVADLEKRRIPYELAQGGATILVSGDQVDATRLAVMSSDLPLKGTVGFELFNKSDMGLTDFAQKINYQRALQGELERTIMTLDGVETARVHLSLGEDRIFRDDRVPPKGSVTIRMAHSATLSVKAAQGVQRLVAAAVPQLDVANVVILDERGGVASATVEPVRSSQTMSPAMEEKRAVEEYYEAKVREALDAAFLRDGVAVSVEADIVVSPDGGIAAPGAQDAATRNFGLKVTLTPRLTLPIGWQDSARTLVGQAIGSAAAGSDEVYFATQMASMQVPATADDAAPDRPRVIDASGPSAVETPGWALEAGLAATPIVFLLGVLLLLRRARGPKRLSARERSAFATKLRLALAPEDGNVTTRS